MKRTDKQSPQQTIVTRKIGMNKGYPRIWLEGKLLDEVGFRHYQPYTVDIGPDRVVLVLDPKGTRKVAGKAKPTEADPNYWHPVIDLHQKALVDFVKKATEVQVSLSPGLILIERQQR